jgi:hypothetical protein
MRTSRTVLMILALLPGATHAAAWQRMSDGVVVSCAPEAAALNCEWRAASAAPVSFGSATLDGQSLPPTSAMPYPWSDAATAILVLVDTSDPGRQAVIEANIRQIGSVASAARPHQKLGLAAFDKNLRMLAPIGSSRDVIRATAASLRAEGKTTEFYRNVLQGIDALRDVPAARRALIIFSDGQAEDQAYFHNDVVAAAQAAGVSIHSFGFPRSVALSVALQTLRRLSDETGGLYAESDAAFAVTDAALAAPLAAADSGGRLAFDLEAMRKTAPEATTLTLAFNGGAGPARVDVPIEPAPQAAPEPAAVPAPAVTAAPPPVERPAPIFWYGLPILLLLLVIAALTAMYSLLRRAQTVAKPADAAQPAAGYRPLAYLISQESRPRSFPITREIWRIGRSRDNEMALEDVSVSRRHAEIQRTPEGRFTIMDRHSTNGVFINGRRIGKGELREGDIIEIGDVALRFTESLDYQMGERTVVQDTRRPVH